MLNKTKISTFLPLLFVSAFLAFIPETPAQAQCWRNISDCKPNFENTPFDPKTWSPADWLKSGAGEACEAHVLATAQRNTDREQGLDPIQREYLRPYFGDLVDQVTVKWDSLLNDNWSFAGHQIQSGSAAQALGNTIFIAEKEQPYSTSQLVLLAHEFVHVQQYQRHGNLDNYCREYMTGYAQGGYDYENNSFEIEASNFEYKFASELKDKIPVTKYEYTASFPSHIQRSAIVLPTELPRQNLDTFSENIIIKDGNILARRGGELVLYQDTNGDGRIDAGSADNVIDTGWGQFQDLIYIGNGNILARRGGDLVLYQDTNGDGRIDAGSADNVIDTGWGQFQDLTYIGNGNILARRGEDLILYQDTNGDGRIDAGSADNVIDTGWGQFQDLTYIGNGNILARRGGDLVLYQDTNDDGRIDAGSADNVIDTGWNQFQDLTYIGN
ncbi:tachylectin-related carbohydrate-binding protein [Pleurocapsa sp. PCC 7319]|uniref:tachylectin-related carbohydrate-binding protein n=1 Tax=Pleurocapsa sp. PCC 7319 TaxID=118161 RepID=UPI000346AE36|nr:tachylectin-related carbohydrate-binding protein [Pleurocapsa sp. PCC 7319]